MKRVVIAALAALVAFAAVTPARAALDDAVASHDAHPDQDEAMLERYIPVPPAVLKTIPHSTYINGISASQVGFWSELMSAQKLLNKSADPKVVLAP